MTLSLWLPNISKY